MSGDVGLTGWRVSGMGEPKFTIHITEPPPLPPIGPCRAGGPHRWTWVQLTSGGECQVCYRCGKERR